MTDSTAQEITAASIHSFSKLGWGADVLRAIFTIMILKTIETTVLKLMTLQKKGQIDFRKAVVSDTLNRAFSIPGIIQIFRQSPVLDVSTEKSPDTRAKVGRVRLALYLVSFLAIIIASETALLVGSYTRTVAITASSIKLEYVAGDKQVADRIPDDLGCKWFQTEGKYYSSVISTGLCIADESGDSKSLNLQSNTGSVYFSFRQLPSGIQMNLSLSAVFEAYPLNTTSTLLAVTVTPDKGVLRTKMDQDSARRVMKNWILSSECIASYTPPDGIPFTEYLDSIDLENPPTWVGCATSLINNTLATAGDVLRKAAALYSLKTNEGTSPWSGSIESDEGDTTATVGYQERTRLDPYLLLGIAAGNLVVMIVIHYLPSYDDAVLRTVASSQLWETRPSAAINEIPEQATMELLLETTEEDPETYPSAAIDEIPEQATRKLFSQTTEEDPL